MSGTYLWTECGYRHAASWRFFIFTVPSHKTEDQLTHSSWRLRDTSFRCSSVKPEIDLCAFDRKQPPHDDTKRAQLPHGELAADWRDSRFCTLSNPRQPVLPGREYSGESIARVIDASADVAFIRCVGNPVLERRDTLHGRGIFFFFFRFRMDSSNFVGLMRRVCLLTELCVTARFPWKVVLLLFRALFRDFLKGDFATSNGGLAVEYGRCNEVGLNYEEYE